MYLVHFASLKSSIITYDRYNLELLSLIEKSNYNIKFSMNKGKRKGELFNYQTITR